MFSLNLLLAFPIAMSAQVQRTLPVTANFKIDDGSLDQSYMVMENMTTGEKQTIKGVARFNLALKYNCEYILAFSKPGYITKKIAINTTAPAERIDQGFYTVPFDVYLFKQYDGVNIVVFNQPVAKYNFNRMLDEFFYDTDYTKQIQSVIREAEDELKKKKEETEKNAVLLKKESEKQKADSLAQARADAKFKSDSLEQARKLTAQQQAEERKQKLAQDEEERKQARIRMEDETKAKARLQLEEEERKKLLAAKEAEERKKAEALAREEEESKRKARIAEEQELRKSSAVKTTAVSDSHPAETVSDFPYNIRVEEINEANRVITKAVVSSRGREWVYLKIVYKWGGIYYFKDQVSISDNMFRQATGLK